MEDHTNNVFIGIALGVIIMIGCFLDWSSGTEDSIYALDSSGAPSFFRASSEDERSAKKGNPKSIKKENSKSANKDDIAPAKQPDTFNYFYSNKPSQSVDVIRKGN